MNDIDFEELDRQISSLTSGGPRTPQPGSASAPSTPQPTVSTPAQPPTPSTPAPVATPQPRPAAPNPSIGRFMDVVHPSSDMRSAPPVPPRPAPSPAPTPTVPSQPPAPTPSSDIAPVPTSPFLPNAKVEKRPLGASNPSPLPGQTAANSQKDQTPLPPELNDELLSVETGDETSPQEKPEKPTEKPVTEEKPMDMASVLQKHIDDADKKPNDKTAPAFNAEAYKQPKKKSKSGWMTMLWIVLLVVLGAGAGAAIYFYVLPTL